MPNNDTDLTEFDLSGAAVTAKGGAYPKPIIIASVIFGHILLFTAIININPNIFDMPKVLKIDIINQPPVQNNKQISPNRVQETNPQPETLIDRHKQTPQETHDVQTQTDVQKPQNIVIPRETIRKIETPNLKVTEIQKIEEEEEIKLEKIDPVTIPKPNLQKLQSPDIELKQEYKAQRLDNNQNLKTVSPNLNLPNKDLRIDLNKLNQRIDNEQRQQELAQKRALEAQKQAQESEAIATKNGTLRATQSVGNNSSLSGGSAANSGVTAIGGASGGGAAGRGVLPNAPTSANAPISAGGSKYNGRNVFEENENNSLLARMGRTADCARLNRERDEKCKDWAPLDGKIGKYIPPKTPKLPPVKPNNTDLLPACPPGTPNSNFGLSCLPNKN